MASLWLSGCTVAPGQTYDFSVNLTAPTTPGVYQGFWQMRNPAGTPFGETIWVGIRVPAPPQPTAAPTQTPVPNISFTVNSTNINQGQCVTFQWSVTNVQAVYFYADGQNWQNNGVAGQGSSTQCPTQTTTYYLRVVQNDGTVETRAITIYVTPVANAPQITQFSLNPSTLQVGQCLTIQWNVSGDVTTVQVLRNNASLWDGAPIRGSMQDCPPGAGQMTYTLVATGPRRHQPGGAIRHGELGCADQHAGSAADQYTGAATDQHAGSTAADQHTGSAADQHTGSAAIHRRLVAVDWHQRRDAGRWRHPDRQLHAGRPTERQRRLQHLQLDLSDQRRLPSAD